MKVTDSDHLIVLLKWISANFETGQCGIDCSASTLDICNGIPNDCESSAVEVNYRWLFDRVRVITSFNYKIDMIAFTIVLFNVFEISVIQTVFVTNSGAIISYVIIDAILEKKLIVILTFSYTGLEGRISVPRLIFASRIQLLLRKADRKIF